MTTKPIRTTTLVPKQTEAVNEDNRLTAPTVGFLCALGGFGIWGAFPVYFKALNRVPALEVLAHRIVWSVLLLAVMLLLAGLITVVPLMLFLEATQRLRLATVGLIQYLTTLQFILAVVVYREPLTPAQLLTFACIWTALAIYSVDAVAALRDPAAPRWWFDKSLQR